MSEGLKAYQIVNFIGYNIEVFTIQQIEILIQMLKLELKKRGVDV